LFDPFQAIILRIKINTRAARDKNGMVINPNHSINFVVHEKPCTQGAALSGKIL
jgi:hypothetical protein